MSNQTGTKQKLPVLKIVLWILGILVALQIVSGGAFFGEVADAWQDDDKSNPTSATVMVSKPYFGVSGQDAQDNAGALVTEVKAGSPAEKAGIQQGDIITAVGTQKISNGQDFVLALQAYASGDTVEIVLLRNGQELILSVTFEEKVEVVTNPEKETEVATTHPQEEGSQPGGSQSVATQPQNTAPPPQNTAPPQSSPQSHDWYSAWPKDMREHVLLGSRGSGVSATLTGKVLITVVFVNDATSTWTANDIADKKAADASQIAKIMEEAASYGAVLNITMDYRQASVDITEEADSDLWAEKAIAGAGLGSISTASAELERTRGVKEAPILLYVNATERSFARPNSTGDTEYAVVWNEGEDTLRHELYHLFGAPDYYMPRSVKESAQKYCPDSVMLGGEKIVTDDLTAYLIGWTDTLSANALAFLQATANVTRDEVAQEYDKETHTGYVENWEKHGDYITGYLDFGILEGQGKVVYADGSWKEGFFEYGELIRGRCKIFYEDGGWYEGDYDYGTSHGQGKALYADGSYYEGSFVKGVLEGQGKMVWADGSSYSGQWKNGQFHGYGKRIDADGGWYEGDFRDGLSHGRGKVVYADGNWYEGDFTQGSFNGQGTFAWANGDRYTGAFVNGAFHGYGTYTWPNGNSMSGMWENGKYIG